MKCPNCDLCNKQGLPILLTRYAIAPTEANAPQLSGQFTLAGAPPLGEMAHYTQRLLRQGFVYEYNETMDRWRCHVVHDEGYLMPFDIDSDGPKASVNTGDPNQKKKPCEPEIDGAIAGCVCVPHSELGVLWFAFSDVEWTNAVWKTATDVKWRKANMRKIDVTNWGESKSTRVDAKHAAGINEVEKYITEFSGQTKSSAFAFCADPFIARNRYVDFTPLATHLGIPAPAPFAITNAHDSIFNFNTNALTWIAFYREVAKKATAIGANYNELIRTMRNEGAYTGLLHQFKRLDPYDKLPPGRKGVILALHDPAGIIKDIAALINYKFVEFDRPYDRKLAVSQAIEGLHKTIMDQAEEKLINSSSERARRQELFDIRNPIGDEIRVLSKAQIDFARTEAWNKYFYLDYEMKEIYVDDAAWEDFQARHPETGEKYDPRKRRKNEFGNYLPPRFTEPGGEYWNYIENERRKFKEAQHRKRQVAHPPIDYKPRFDEEERAKFQSFYDEQLTKFTEGKIKSMVVAHAAWAKHKDLLKYFDGFFDPDNFDSGLVFSSVLSECIGNTQGLGPCSEVYDKWLDTDLSVKENLLARGMYLNQDILAQAAENLVPQGTLTLTQAKLFEEAMNAVQEGAKGSILGEAIEKARWYELQKHIAAVSSRLTALFSSVLLRAAKSVKEFARKILVAAGLAQSRALIMVSVEGQRINYARAIVTRALRALHGETNTHLRNKVEKILESLPKQYTRGTGGYSTVIPLWISEEDLIALREESQMRGPGSKARAHEIASKIRTGPPEPHATILADAVVGRGTPERLEELQESVRLRDLDLSEASSQRNLAPGISSIFLIVQMWGLKASYEAALKADSIGKETWDPLGRFVASIIGTGSAAVSALEKVAARFSARLGPATKERIEWIVRGGKTAKWLGAGAGFVMGAVDVVLGFKAYQAGKTGLAWIQMGSGALGIIGAWLLLCSSPWTAPVGVILLIGSIALSVYLEHVKENDTQDWLYRCVFGHAPDYPTGAREKELDESFAGWGKGAYKFQHAGIERLAFRAAMGAAV